MGYNVAVDGPAGAGKSTIAKKVAKDLGFIYVDTGAMYRSMALLCIENNIDKEDEAAVVTTCSKADITIAYENEEQQVYLNGRNVNGLIRTEEVGNTASKVSVYPKVREKLVELQMKLAKSSDIIMDGRDIGTCVLPNADVKIYLTAGSRVRALRRYNELTAKGVECNLDEIEKDIIARDERDMNREISPLRKADDAILVDSSDMTIEEVVNAIKDIINKDREA